MGGGRRGRGVEGLVTFLGKGIVGAETGEAWGRELDEGDSFGLIVSDEVEGSSEQRMFKSLSNF